MFTETLLSPITEKRSTLSLGSSSISLPCEFMTLVTMVLIILIIITWITRYITSWANYRSWSIYGGASKITSQGLVKHIPNVTKINITDEIKSQKIVVLFMTKSFWPFVALLSFRSPKHKNTLETINEKLPRAVKTTKSFFVSQKTHAIRGNPTV